MKLAVGAHKHAPFIHSMEADQQPTKGASHTPTRLVAWFQIYAYGKAGGGGVGSLLKMEITGQPVTFES